MTDEEKLRTLLSIFDIGIIVKTSTVSTNTDGKKLFRSGLSSPVLIVADEQTGGRGRQGKTFLSPRGGLYMTLVLPLAAPIGDAVMATSCSAVAVSRALGRFGIDCGIKWVNDIYSGEKKVCGILAESVFAGDKPEFTVVGIGMNLFEPADGYGKYDDVAGAVLPGVTNEPALLNKVAATVADNFWEIYREGDTDGVYRRYKEGLCHLEREVTVRKKDGDVTAFAADLDRNYRLLVRYADGREEYLSSGEIGIIL